jgi:hypothetical protein
MNKQQTPNPEAQLPSAAPLDVLHSSLVMHVPIMVASEAALHEDCCENQDKWRRTLNSSFLCTRNTLLYLINIHNLHISCLADGHCKLNIYLQPPHLKLDNAEQREKF